MKKNTAGLGNWCKFKKTQHQFEKTEKRIKQHQLFCKKRSCWNTSGRTEEWWVKMINSEPLPGRWKKTLGCQGTYLCLYWMSYGWVTFLRQKPNSLLIIQPWVHKKTCHDTLLSKRHGISQHESQFIWCSNVLSDQ